MGGAFITLKNNGLFFKVETSDAIICYYLYLNILHEFINNQYDYYLMLASKKYEIQRLINSFRVYYGR